MRERLAQRAQILREVRRWMESEHFLEIEPSVLAPWAGMEPSLDPLTTLAHLGVEADPTLLYHQTSPEYAMKKLLAAGYERIYSMGKVFRDYEGSPLHQIEFTMLEWYRAEADYIVLMDDTEALVEACSIALNRSSQINYQGHQIELQRPWERITVSDAMLRWAGIDLGKCNDVASFRGHAREAGYEWMTDEDSESLFFKLWITHVEPNLGKDRPVWIIDYPIRFGALARAKPDDSSVAERCEAYIAGIELCNGFSELTDAVEQRRRLESEQAQRKALGKEVVPEIDEDFLKAAERMPDSAGNALGIDRLVMLLTDAATIEEVVAFPLNP